MAQSLQELLQKQVKRMVVGIGRDGLGNIHPLIMNEVERSIIELVLKETSGNLFLTSKLLGISRSKLYRKIDRLGVSQSTVGKSNIVL